MKIRDFLKLSIHTSFAGGLIFLSLILSAPARSAPPVPAHTPAPTPVLTPTATPKPTPRPVAQHARIQLGELPSDGPNWVQASGSLKYEWVRRGGDYLDSTGAQNGPAHFAKIIPQGNPDPYWDVTELVNKLLIENTAIYLSMTRGTNPPRFASRESDKPAKLTIVTSAGTFNPPLISDSWIAPSSNQCIGSDTRISFPAMLKFDLSGVKGSVQKAELRVTYTNTYEATNELAADYLDMPLLITDPAAQLGGVEGGLAATVAKDNDLARHPAVLWYPRMDSEVHIRADWSFISSNYPGKRVSINPQFVDWPEYGLKALRMESQSPGNKIPGDTGSSILTWREYINESTKQVSGAKAVGTQSYNELYVRYMLKIDPDVYLGMTEGGVKLPGFEGSGFSARMEHLAQSAANPHVYRLFIYWYGAQNPFDSPNRGGARYTKVSLRAGQIYSIEQRIKQNTRNADGKWNADGAVEVWVDGVKVYSDLKAFINNTKWPAEINNFFANVYHGGSGMPKSPIHYEFGGVAISTRYIGPPKKIGAAALPVPR